MSPPRGILIVGAGPVGLLLAVLLHRYDVPVKLIDQNTAPHSEVRATGVQPRTLELLKQIDLADRFVDAGVRIETLNTYSRDLRLLKSQRFAPSSGTRYPFILGLPQYRTEALIADELSSLGGEVERGTELTGFKQDDDGVTVAIRSDGCEEEARFDYLVGCDGAHSTVRNELGWHLQGGDYAQPFIVIEAEADWPFSSRELAYVVGENKFVAGFHLPGQRIGFFGNIPADRGELWAGPTDAHVRELLAESGPEGLVVHKVHWASLYHEHHRCAPAFQDGRVFLAGDAAHICSSIGAQGMNQGLQDAYNLGWKLAHVARHGADAALLDSYGHERLAVAKGELALTDAIYQGQFGEDHSLPRWFRKSYQGFLARFESTQERERETMAQLRVGYRGSPIVDEIASGGLGFLRGDKRTAHFADRLLHHGPRAGDRLPEGRLETPGGESVPLAEALGEGIHTLLLLAGPLGTDEEVEKLLDISVVIGQRYGELVQPRVVACEAALIPPAPLGLVDPKGEVHHLLGADSDCLYLVRPDLYIGFRSNLAELAPLRAYLDGVLRGGGGG